MHQNYQASSWQVKAAHWKQRSSVLARKQYSRSIEGGPCESIRVKYLEGACGIKKVLTNEIPLFSCRFVPEAELAKATLNARTSRFANQEKLVLVMTHRDSQSWLSATHV